MTDVTWQDEIALAQVREHYNQDPATGQLVPKDPTPAPVATMGTPTVTASPPPEPMSAPVWINWMMGGCLLIAAFAIAFWIWFYAPVMARMARDVIAERERLRRANAKPVTEYALTLVPEYGSREDG